VRFSVATPFVLAGVVAVALAVPAAAQDAARSLKPATFPRWDLGGSIGSLNLTNTEIASSWGTWHQKAEFRVDGGYYWTTHLKTDVSVSTSNQWHDYETVRFDVPGIPNAYAYDEITRQFISVSPAMTWQFRENQFMHPYVSGGVRIGLLQEHLVRQGGTLRSGTLGYTVTPLDERRTEVVARPFVAGGFKSYVSRRVFARTEARLAFAQDGIRQVSVAAGIGVDF
jgi:hypothetical protein